MAYSGLKAVTISSLLGMVHIYYFSVSPWAQNKEFIFSLSENTSYKHTQAISLNVLSTIEDF